MISLRRRHLLAAGTAWSALSVGAVGVGRAVLGPTVFAQELTALRVALAWIANVEYAGLWLAIERGFFAEEGLSIEFLPGGPNASPGPVTVAAGEAELGFTVWLPFLDAVARGNDFVMLAATFPVYPLGIISLPQRPIRTAQDLVGARILAQGPNERTVIGATLALNGLPRDSWEFVPAGFSPEPLLAGQGDGYTAFATNQVVSLERMGLVRDQDFFFTSFPAMGYNAMTSIVFAERRFVEANRPQVVGFLRALTRGWRANEKDPKIAAELVVNRFGIDYGLDLAQQVRQNEIQIGMMRSPENPTKPLLVLDRALIEGPMYEAARASGRTDLPSVEQIADFSLMEEVVADLGAE